MVTHILEKGSVEHVSSESAAGALCGQERPPKDIDLVVDCIRKTHNLLRKHKFHVSRKKLRRKAWRRVDKDLIVALDIHQNERLVKSLDIEETFERVNFGLPPVFWA